MYSRATPLLALSAIALAAPLAAQTTTVSPHHIYGHRDGMAMYYDVETPGSPNGLGIVFMVSGGWVSGADNLNISRPFWTVLLEEGYTLFEVYHPAMPRYRIPDAVDAVRLAVADIKQKSESFGVDSNRLGVFGISAGGHLALQAAFEVDPAERAEGDFKAVVAIMPITDVANIPPETELFGARQLDFDAGLIPQISPINFVTPDDPPTLLVHGTLDRAVDPQQNSVRLQARLDETGVENGLLMVEAGHEIFPEPLMEEVHAAMLAWFEENL